MRAIRVVWKDERAGEVVKDETVAYDGPIAAIGDAIEISGFASGVRLCVEFHFDPPMPQVAAPQEHAQS